MNIQLEAIFLFDRLKKIYAAADQIAVIEEKIRELAPRTADPAAEAEALFLRLDRNYTIKEIEHTLFRLQ